MVTVITPLVPPAIVTLVTATVEALAVRTPPFPTIKAGVSAADTWAVDVVPGVKGDKVFYGHTILIKQHGIYILEVMNTGRLAKESVHEFMFVLGQARIKGTVQMIINPVAMW